MVRNCFVLKRFEATVYIVMMPVSIFGVGVSRLFLCGVVRARLPLLWVLFGVRCSNPHGAHAGISVLTKHLVGSLCLRCI